MNSISITNTTQLMDVLPRVQKYVHDIAKSKGWWDTPPEDGTVVALMHAELSEALEAMRHGWPQSEVVPEVDPVTEELADVVIRILDFAGRKELPLAEAIVSKIEYNRTRPHKHGGKKF